MITPFYQSANYEALRDRKIRRKALGDNITLGDRHPTLRDAFLRDYGAASVERAGVLHGEYILHPSGLLLFDRSGAVAAGCISLEDHFSAQQLAAQAGRPELAADMRYLTDNWDRLPVARNLPLLCDPYSHNYFHFSLEMVPRARFFLAEERTTMIITKSSLSRQFQRDLLSRALSGVSYLPMEGSVRVRDPVIAHDTMSEEGILWLRESSRISAGAGDRRIYIRRASRGTRSALGGGVSESPGFLALLRDFGFETVDFGNGERGVAEQVAMLEGVGLILAAHGAALTNLAYLNPKLTVIEVIGPGTLSACFMHIAATLGFAYHGAFSGSYDDRSDIVVDLDELYEVLRRTVAQTI